MQSPSLSLLSRLWLSEPGPAELIAARELPGFDGLARDPAELARAWTDLFLLNVYPYASVFCEPAGELNGASARTAARSYEEGGYRPAELFSVGAPDHVGLCLGFLDHVRGQGSDARAFAEWLGEWLPACCVAVEREPWAHPFYRAVAVQTRREALSFQLSASSQRSPAGSWKLEAGSALPIHENADEEVSLSDVVRFLLAPALAGFFLSRAKWGQIARSAGLTVPFGSRFDVARGVLAAAGESDRIADVLSALEREAGQWRAEYGLIAAAHPGWSLPHARWMARLDRCVRRVDAMRSLLHDPPALEYGEREPAGPREPVRRGPSWEKIEGT